jgi:hypothetical protein
MTGTVEQDRRNGSHDMATGCPIAEFGCARVETYFSESVFNVGEAGFIPSSFGSLNDAEVGWVAGDALSSPPHSISASVRFALRMNSVSPVKPFWA